MRIKKKKLIELAIICLCSIKYEILESMLTFWVAFCKNLLLALQKKSIFLIFFTVYTLEILLINVTMSTNNEFKLCKIPRGIVFRNIINIIKINILTGGVGGSVPAFFLKIEKNALILQRKKRAMILEKVPCLCTAMD